jgi:hypothetical protein
MRRSHARGVSVNTVRTQVSSILGKLAFSSRAELAALEGRMAMQQDGPLMRRSFCGRSEREVEHLIAGRPRVYICRECAVRCNEIIAQARKAG